MPGFRPRLATASLELTRAGFLEARHKQEARKTVNRTHDLYENTRTYSLEPTIYMKNMAFSKRAIDIAKEIIQEGLKWVLL